MSEKSDQHGEESRETDLVETGAADFAPEFEPSSLSLEAEVGGGDLSGTDKGGEEGEKGSGGGLGVRELALQAIKAKLTQGKALSAAEWKRLEQEEKGEGPSDDGKIWVKTQIELAESLGVDRRSVTRYLAEVGNPGRAADGRYDLKAWRDWVRAKGTVRPAGPSEKERLELEILRSENETKKLKLAEARGEMVSLEEAMLVLGGMFAELRPRLQQLKHDLVPKLVGLPVEDAMEKMQGALNQVLGEVAVPGEAKKKVFWRTIAERFLHLQAS
jgi:hypothetical protein